MFLLFCPLLYRANCSEGNTKIRFNSSDCSRICLCMNTVWVQLPFIYVCVCMLLPWDGYSCLLACSHGYSALKVMQLAEVLPQCAASLEIPCYIYRTLRNRHKYCVSLVLLFSTAAAAGSLFRRNALRPNSAAHRVMMGQPLLACNVFQSGSFSLWRF